MNPNVDIILPNTIKEIIELLGEQEGISLMRALDMFYRSNTYLNLIDLETGMYIQSSPCILECYNKDS